MVAKKRERLEIIYDILIAIRNNRQIGPTRLLYASNLSSKMFKEYIEELNNKQFIFEKEEKNKKYFTLSQKGYEYIEKYKEMITFIDNFGL